MGSSGLFQFAPPSHHPHPHPLSLSSGKRPLILLPGFSSYRKIQCSWIPAVAVLTLSPCSSKKRVKGAFSRAPSFSFPPGKEGWSGGRGGQLWSNHCPSFKSCDPAGHVCFEICPISVNAAMWQIKQSFLTELKWAEYEMVALTQSTCLDYKPRCSIRD